MGLAGAEPNGESRAPAVSEDGRWIAFKSFANNLVVGDTNAFGDVFVLDRDTGVTTLVSISASGGAANGESYAPAVSSSARSIAFYSAASNLVTGDTNARMDVFVRDRIAGTTTLVSRTPGGALGNGDSDTCSISLDGMRIAFRSAATNLVTGDTNGRVDIFLRDIATGVTSILSRGAANVQANQHSFEPVLSGDGRAVCFSSDATNLVSVDTNGVRDIFLRDLAAGTVTRLSESLAGTQGNAASDRPTISRDGRWIAFDSAASNLAPGDTGTVIDAFLVTSNRDTLVQVTRGNALSQECALSGDGTTLAFSSAASNLVPGDTNARLDVFVYDIESGALRRESAALDGTQGNGDSQAPALGYGNNVLAYRSAANNLVLPDTNGVIDLFCSSREFTPIATVPLPAGLDLTDACLASGDFDGDTFDELFLGCPNAVGPTGSPEGAVLIFRGTATGLEPQPAWTLYGGQPDCRFGFSLASAVDTNGDCLQDLLVGAPAYDNGELNEGAAFLFRGRAAGGPISPPADSSREGDEVGAEFGYSVAFYRVAYVPGISWPWDAFDSFDWVVGAPGASGGAGRVATSFQSFWGGSPSARLGTVVLGVDIDRCTDSSYYSASPTPTYFFASAPGYSTASGVMGAVSAYRCEGAHNSGNVSYTLTELAMAVGTQAGAGFGTSMAAGPDLDADGTSDIIVGSPLYNSAVSSRCGRITALSFGATLFSREGAYRDAMFGEQLVACNDLDSDGALDVLATSRLDAVGLYKSLSLRGGADGLSAPGALVAVSASNPADRVLAVGGRGRLTSNAALLCGGPTMARIELFSGLPMSEPCVPFLTETVGQGLCGTGYSCDPNDCHYTQVFYLVNPTCRPTSWSLQSPASSAHFQWHGPLKGQIGPREVLSSEGMFDFLCIECTGPSFGFCFDMLLGGVQRPACVSYSNYTQCYDLSINPQSMTLECSPGENSASITLHNSQCRDTPWIVDWSSTFLPPGVTVFPDSGIIGPRQSIDVTVEMDCNVATTGQYFTLNLQYQCYYGIQASVLVNLGSCHSNYCTPSTSAEGCAPTLSANGIPSEPNSLTGAQYQPFQLRMAGLPAQRAGLLFYGLSQAAMPWAQGSSSTLCVSFPVERLGLGQSGGTANLCDGMIEIDLNAYLRANPSALGSPLQAGRSLYVQGWYRDPTAPKGTSLSDAMAVQLCR